MESISSFLSYLDPHSSNSSLIINEEKVHRAYNKSDLSLSVRNDLFAQQERIIIFEPVFHP